MGGTSAGDSILKPERLRQKRRIFRISKLCVTYALQRHRRASRGIFAPFWDMEVGT